MIGRHKMGQKHNGFGIYSGGRASSQQASPEATGRRPSYHPRPGAGVRLPSDTLAAAILAADGGASDFATFLESLPEEPEED